MAVLALRGLFQWTEKMLNRQTVRATLHARPEPAPPTIEKAPEIAVPRSPHATIRVLVKLPTGDVKLEFRKPNVASNVSLSKLTEREFERAIRTGIEQLLGQVERVEVK